MFKKIATIVLLVVSFSTQSYGFSRSDVGSQQINEQAQTINLESLTKFDVVRASAILQSGWYTEYPNPNQYSDMYISRDGQWIDVSEGNGYFSMICQWSQGVCRMQPNGNSCNSFRFHILSSRSLRWVNPCNGTSGQARWAGY